MSAKWFPSSLDALTPAILTEVLADQHPEILVRDFEIIEHSHRGDGSASTADRVVLGLSFAEGRDAGVPERLLLKTVLLHKGRRLGPSAIAATGALLGVFDRLPFGGQLRRGLFSGIRAYQKRYPQAPDAMYLNEVRFYRELRPELSIEAPRSFASVYDEENRTFGVLMEDLSLRDAEFPNATMTLRLGQIRSLLSTLATLHAHYWESPRLRSDLAWVATPRSGGMYPVFRTLGLDLIRNQVETNPFKGDLIAPLGRSVDELWAALWRAQELLDSGPCTILHGDPHVANTYLLPDESAGLLDWQLMVRGRWAHDVTYILVTALSTEDRRKDERELLSFYLESLRENGVGNPPTLDDAWEIYRRAVAWGLVIGWLITPPENYGETITAANIRRLVDAALDLDTFRLLSGS
ncbi:MAG: phosphotransferase [Deltaproteobacteria bacterium]|jgi:hypothetical protein|nr:phosphotransferase [Deltaproteobacteria bacterium]